MVIDYLQIINLFTQIAEPAFAVAFVFGFGGKIVNSFLSMSLDGWFKI